MPYETNLIFKLDKDDAYTVSGYFRIPSNNGKEPANWKAKEKEMLDGMEKRYRADFLKGLRERQEYEVPNQSGICLIRGFIADDGGKPFKANTAVRFAKQTDMRLEMLHGAVLQPGERPCSNATSSPKKARWPKSSKPPATAPSAKANATSTACPARKS